jgi:acetyltransferase-like isoleucine patch superfamily enzyme
MKKRISYFISKYAGNRYIVCYGCGKNALSVYSEMRSIGIIVDFFVDIQHQLVKRFAELPVESPNYITKEQHYIILTPSMPVSTQIEQELNKMGFRVWLDYYPYYKEGVSVDFEYDGVPIGKYSYGYTSLDGVMGVNNHFNMINRIGRYCSINERAYVHGSHYLDKLSTYTFSFLPPPPHHRLVIGNDVWIGVNAFINSSKVNRIGDGSIIAANAVVNSNVPDYAVVAGVPAKVIKYRFNDNQIDVLNRVKWWEWDDDKILENKIMFEKPEVFFEKFP